MERLSSFVIKHSFAIGLYLAILFFTLSFYVLGDSRTNSVLLNLATDFFVLGLTLSIIDKIIRKSEQLRYGNVPKRGIDEINRDIRSLLSLCAFNLENAMKADANDVMETALVKNALSKTDDLSERLYIVHYAQLSHVDPTKVTYTNFSEALRFVEGTLKEIDEHIERYGFSFSPETRAQTMAVRDGIADLLKGSILFLSVKIGAQKHPQSLLTKREQDSFERLLKGIMKVTKNILMVR